MNEIAPGSTLEKALGLYTRYYNINRETPAEPFAAEALFQAQDEQYFLIKAAKLGDSETNEFVFFAEEENLTAERLVYLDQTAWETGLSRVNPHSGHRNSDVTLVVLCDHMDDDVKKKASQLNHYKSYRFTLHGWSSYRLIVVETTSGKMAHNRQGQELKSLFNNIF